MRMKLVLFAVAAMTAGVAHAGSQSSNTSSNSSSNNGVVRERIVETYCEDGYCERYVRRRVYRDDWHGGDANEWPRRRDRYHGDDD
ncbi:MULTISPECIES: hypothetical protein [unclassified Ensifer]|uniref:hypothetical protein n=1 Tax=unclassified Ensifer TaxID=2633371 RepID=UPI0008133071|nr:MULTISPECIES: hypothetical protein [unclassified Ensifer]OCP01717.1 hypothetical protein BC362_21070 [Ensifer sp. LC14]OCP09505.1 hypothetical protein BC374_02810 [Ensifer sp. LC13]OCP10679.1 hypothetical protein BBX50_03155 [Ensifer sp. LC11]OCP32754.1 hypothetical protein BC364_02810 [Ensifer sp. LC499]